MARHRGSFGSTCRRVARASGSARLRAARARPCDVYYVSASWDMPATIALIALGIGLLVVAWLAERTRADGD
jgi:hypothetical protein